MNISKHLVDSGFWLLLFFQSLFEEVLKNKKNLSFWSNLGFGVAFFPKNNINRATVNSTNRWHTAAYLFLALLFPWNSSLIARKLKILISTRRILVLVVFFFFSNSTWKSAEKWQLLVESWFWLLFLLFKFCLKKCWKMKISKLLVQSWFWCCLFSQKIYQSGDGEQHKQMAYRGIPVLGIAFLGNSSLIARKFSFLVLFFSFQILLEKVLKNGSFWSNLGFGCVFSCSNSTWKSVENLDFAAFGRILVLVVVFSF